MENHNLLGDESGFTLIELISVLIILGVMSVVAVPKYIELEENAKNRAIDAGIAELNGREKLMWAKQLLSGAYQNDDLLFDAMKATDIDGYVLGDDYLWMSNSDPPDPIPIPNIPDLSGGRLSFMTMKVSVRLQRLSSSRAQPAIWIRDNTMLSSSP